MKQIVNIDLKAAELFISAAEMEQSYKKALESLETLESRQGRGNDFLGWLDLPTNTPESLISQCEEVVKRWKGVDLVVVTGIGGSYLGAKAAIDALSHSFRSLMGENSPEIVYAGQNLSEEYMAELMDLMTKKSVACLVISKSGTTTEPAVAFRIIKKFLEDKYGKEEAVNRIVAVTDAARGALKTLANLEGYTTFVIPDDVGGRFSVLTPVGLLPIALAGFNIKEMLKGAAEMASICSVKDKENPAVKYAAVRNALYQKGKKIELLVNYTPKLQYVAEWWKQLYGESEGKEGKGIFPASVNFTTDLHSMGQYIQDGERTLFETVLSVTSSRREVVIEDDPKNLDGLNFLSGKRVEECNKMAE